MGSSSSTTPIGFKRTREEIQELDDDYERQLRRSSGIAIPPRKRVRAPPQPSAARILKQSRSLGSSSTGLDVAAALPQPPPAPPVRTQGALEAPARDRDELHGSLLRKELEAVKAEFEAQRKWKELYHASEQKLSKEQGTRADLEVEHGELELACAALEFENAELKAALVTTQGGGRDWDGDSEVLAGLCEEIDKKDGQLAKAMDEKERAEARAEQANKLLMDEMQRRFRSWKKARSLEEDLQKEREAKAELERLYEHALDAFLEAGRRAEAIRKER